MDFEDRIQVILRIYFSVVLIYCNFTRLSISATYRKQQISIRQVISE